MLLRLLAGSMLGLGLLLPAGTAEQKPLDCCSAKLACCQANLPCCQGSRKQTAAKRGRSAVPKARPAAPRLTRLRLTAKSARNLPFRSFRSLKPEDLLLWH